MILEHIGWLLPVPRQLAFSGQVYKKTTSENMFSYFCGGWCNGKREGVKRHVFC